MFMFSRHASQCLCCRSLHCRFAEKMNTWPRKWWKRRYSTVLVVSACPPWNYALFRPFHKFLQVFLFGSQNCYHTKYSCREFFDKAQHRVVWNILLNCKLGKSFVASCPLHKLFAAILNAWPQTKAEPCSPISARSHQHIWQRHLSV